MNSRRVKQVQEEEHEQKCEDGLNRARTLEVDARRQIHDCEHSTSTSGFWKSTQGTGPEWRMKDEACTFEVPNAIHREG